MVAFGHKHPFALRSSRGFTFLHVHRIEWKVKGFDKLSPNGFLFHRCACFRNRSMMLRRSAGVMSRQRAISSVVRPQPVQARPALSSLQMLTQGLSMGGSAIT